MKKKNMVVTQRPIDHVKWIFTVKKVIIHSKYVFRGI